MSKNRNYRLRKKLHLAEHAQRGFALRFACADLPVPDCLAALTTDVLDSREMAFVSDGAGTIFVSRRAGSANEGDREAVKAWGRTQDAMAGFELGPLVDAWYPPRHVRAFEASRSRRKPVFSLSPLRAVSG